MGPAEILILAVIGVLVGAAACEKIAGREDQPRSTRRDRDDALGRAYDVFGDFISANDPTPHPQNRRSTYVSSVDPELASRFRATHPDRDRGMPIPPFTDDEFRAFPRGE